MGMCLKAMMRMRMKAMMKSSNVRCLFDIEFSGFCGLLVCLIQDSVDFVVCLLDTGFNRLIDFPLIDARTF